MHDDQVRRHGGAFGTRDAGLLESALERPRNRWKHSDDPDLAELAAAYGFGLVTKHPFVDGNKRVAFVSMYVFLALNGVELDASEPAVVSTMRARAAGSLGEEDLATWLRTHLRAP